MTNKHLVLAVVIGVVVVALGFMGFNAIDLASNQKTVSSLGAANVTAYNGLNNQALVNELNLIANPLVAIEQTTTASIAFTAVGTSTAQSTATTIGIVASLGDIVLVSPNGTTTGVMYNAQVTTASTSSATININAVLASGTVAVTPNAQTFNVTVLPFASFKAPVGL